MDALRRWLTRFRNALDGGPRTTKLLLGVIGWAVVLTVFVSVLRPSPTVLCAFYAPTFGALLLLALRRLRIDGGTTAILLVAYAAYLAYLSYTDYPERNYDGAAQVEYIKYIVENGTYPPISQCFVCHHPPLYYALAAIPYMFFERTGLLSPERGLQLFSLGLFLVFLVFSVQLVRRFTTDVRRIRLAASLVAFWPLSFINCVRVHNDTLVSTLMVVALYFTVCWQQGNKPRDLLLAGAAGALAVLTKSTGVVMVATLFALVGYRLVFSPERLRQLKHASVVLAMVATAMVVTKLRTNDEASDSGTFCHKLLGPVCDLYPADWVDRDPRDYVWFDAPRFLADPYLIYRRDNKDRQYFVNHLVKSSLFGTQYTVSDRETAYELNADVATIMNVLLLGMIGFLGVSACYLDRGRLRRYGVVFLGITMFVAFAAAVRFLIPTPHHSDFRHVFPVLTFVALAYASAVGFFRARGSWLAHVGYALAVPFLALSVFYFWPKYDWSVRLMARTERADLAAYAKVVREWTSWDNPNNLLIEGDNAVEFAVDPPRTVTEVDISVDSNDVYEITLGSASGSRSVLVGPSPQTMGLARYVVKIDPPVVQVTRAMLRVKRGDRIYAMGHFILR